MPPHRRRSSRPPGRTPPVPPPGSSPFPTRQGPGRPRRDAPGNCARREPRSRPRRPTHRPGRDGRRTLGHDFEDNLCVPVGTGFRWEHKGNRRPLKRLRAQASLHRLCSMRGGAPDRRHDTLPRLGDRSGPGAPSCAAPECENDAGGRFTIRRSADSQGSERATGAVATSCGEADRSSGAERAAIAAAGATPRPEGLVRHSGECVFTTRPRLPGVAPAPTIRAGRPFSAASRRRSKRSPSTRLSERRASPSPRDSPEEPSRSNSDRAAPSPLRLR